MFEANTFVSSASVGQTTYSGSAYNTLDGGPLDGMDMHILVTAVVGNCNVVFRVSGLLPDGVTWIPLASDPLGPVNTVGERNIHFALGFYGGGASGPSSCTQYRLEALPNELPGGGGSGNSSSLSSQTFPSSSSGGAQQMWFCYGLCPSANG